jgi:hypothetical protein
MKSLLLGSIALFVAGNLASAQTGPLSTPPTTIHELALSAGTKTATAVSGAATLAKSAGVITSEALTTAAGATYTLTLTNSLIVAADQVFASVQNGTNVAGLAEVASITPGAGSVVVVVRNAHASAAFTGTLKISYMLLKN